MDSKTARKYIKIFFAIVFCVLVFYPFLIFHADASVLDPIVNEVLPYPASGPEWVELYNPNSSEIDISGWKLNKANTLGGSPKTFPAGTEIPAYGYLVIEKGVGSNDYAFTLLHYATDVTLFHSDNSVASLLHFPEYSVNNKSWGWYPNADISGEIKSFDTPTKGVSNGGDVDEVSPPVPGLVLPASGSHVKPSVAILDWEDVSDPSVPVTYYYKSFWTGGSYGPVTTGTNSYINATGSADRIYNWQVQACDALNNCSEWSGPWVITIDSISPVTTDSLIDSLWRANSVSRTLNCSDNFGCSDTRYTLDGTNPTVYSTAGTSVSVTTDGIYTLKYFSTDNAGNAEAVKTASNLIKIDKTKPSNITVADSGVWTSSPKLTFSWPESLDGSGSGVAYYQFWLSKASNETNAIDLDAGSSNKWRNVGNTLTYTLTDEEALVLISGVTYYAKVKAVDNARNIASTNVSSWSDGVTLDITIPSSAIISPSPGFYNSSTWDGSFAGTADDSVSGVSKVEVKIKVTTPSNEIKYWDGIDFDMGDSWMDAIGTETWNAKFVPIDGVYTIFYRAVDNAGNIEVENELSEVVFDSTDPQVSLSINPADPDGSNGWYKTEPVVTVVALDTNPDKIEYQYDSETGAWVTYSLPLTVAEGEHTLYYKALDKAGNSSSTTSKSIKVSAADTESPDPVDNLRAEASNSSVVLEWDSSPSLDVDYYRVYRSTDKNYIPNPETRLSEVSSSTKSYDDNDVENGTTYYYYIIVFDTAGNYSEAIGISAEPSSEEEGAEVGPVVNLPIAQGAVLGVEENKNTVPNEQAITREVYDAGKGQVLSGESPMQENGRGMTNSTESKVSLKDFWWVFLIIFGISGVGFFLHKNEKD